MEGLESHTSYALKLTGTKTKWKRGHLPVKCPPFSSYGIHINNTNAPVLLGRDLFRVLHA